MWRRLQQRLSRRRVFSVGVLQCAGVLLRPLRGGPHALQRSVARFAGAGRQLGGTDLLPGPEHRSAHCTLHTTLYSSVQVTWWRQSASPGPARPATGTRGRWSAASVTWRARRSLPALLQFSTAVLCAGRQHRPVHLAVHSGVRCRAGVWPLRRGAAPAPPAPAPAPALYRW